MRNDLVAGFVGEAFAQRGEVLQSLRLGGPLAQTEEHRTFNPRVGGSTPPRPTTAVSPSAKPRPDSIVAKQRAGGVRRNEPATARSFPKPGTSRVASNHSEGMLRETILWHSVRPDQLSSLTVAEPQGDNHAHFGDPIVQGLGHRPFTPATRVRIPLGSPTIS